MPRQPQQDRGRPLGTSAARAPRSAQGVAISSVFIISGPSGAGKGTVIKLVLQQLTGVETTVSATTRTPRHGEEDGREYHFLSRPDFEGAVNEGLLLEWVEYGGNLYGTLRSEVDDRLAAGMDVILEIELQGARKVRPLLPDATAIFIAPPSMGELARRLKGRGTETDESMARRLAIAEREVAAAREFDEVVINDVAERAAQRVVRTISRRRSAVSPE